MELFQPKAALLKEKRLLEYEKPLAILGETPVGAPGGSVLEHVDTIFTEPLEIMLKIISNIEK